jgi:hypothetical protein
MFNKILSATSYGIGKKVQEFLNNIEKNSMEDS